MKSMYLNLFKVVGLIMFSTSAFAYSQSQLQTLNENHANCMKEQSEKIFKELSCDININSSATATNVLNYCGTKLDSSVSRPESQPEQNDIRNLYERVHTNGTNIFNKNYSLFLRNCQLLGALQDELNFTGSDIQIISPEDEGAY